MEVSDQLHAPTALLRTKNSDIYWIGRSAGATVDLDVSDNNIKLQTGGFLFIPYSFSTR
jgi:hypothetical protein